MQIKRLVAAVLLTWLSVAAGGTSLTADQILEKVRNRPDGSDILAEAQLILKEKDGSSRTRNLVFLQKDYGRDEKLTLAFTAPADVKGVILQSVNYDEATAKDDDQWMYLPALRQVRRIAATDKRGSFMGSQFSYIDLDKLRVSDYRQTLVGEEVVDGRPCYIIERTPVSDRVINRTGYHKNIVWVDKETFVVLKQSYVDARGVQFKYFLAKKVEKIQDIWTVTHSEMQDVVNQRSSDLVFSKVRYNAGLDDALFQQNIMKTGVNSGSLPAIR